MDLRTLGHKSNEGYTELSSEEVTRVKSTYFNWQAENWKEIYNDVPEFCKSVDEETLKSNNYSLVPSKYIEFIDHDLEIDYGKEMSRIQQEFKQLLKKEKESQIKVGDAFDGIGYGIK
jgi:type I restriction enzyme M protein